MFRGSSSTDQRNVHGEVNGFLDAGSHMKGELHFEDTFRIEGKLTGSVVSKGQLIVGHRGEIDGDVRVERVYISGTVRGTLRAGERVEITSTGKVMADLFTPSLTIEDGAFFEGKCSMQASALEQKTGEVAKVAKLPAASSK